MEYKNLTHLLHFIYFKLKITHFEFLMFLFIVFLFKTISGKNIIEIFHLLKNILNRKISKLFITNLKWLILSGICFILLSSNSFWIYHIFFSFWVCFRKYYCLIFIVKSNHSIWVKHIHWVCYIFEKRLLTQFE